MLDFNAVLALQPSTFGSAVVRTPKIVDKPWGRELWYADEAEYAGKILAVREGHRLSLQYHERKKETLMVLSGSVKALLGDEEVVVYPGSAFTIAPNTLHRFTALQDTLLLEVSTPHLDDVVRVDCDYSINR
jgi:mannose-6-phosphate isomerase